MTVQTVIETGAVIEVPLNKLKRHPRNARKTAHTEGRHHDLRLINSNLAGEASSRRDHCAAAITEPKRAGGTSTLLRRCIDARLGCVQALCLNDARGAQFERPFSAFQTRGEGLPRDRATRSGSPSR